MLGEGGESKEDGGRVGAVSELPRSVCLALGSGQVVVSLASAAKELVENALDAGATSVELRLRECGAGGFECVDNGVGIASAFHEILCRRHTTSKLTQMEDLMQCDTLGFRGEALSSLAAVAGGIGFITKTKDEDVGHALEYSRMGELTQTQNAARSVGTTVTVRELFKEMPVRRKDLERNIRREYGKLLVLMQSYALISSGTRIIVKNSPVRAGGGGAARKGGASSQAATTTAFATRGGSLRDNFACVFGSSFLPSLDDIDIALHARKMRVTGLISRAAPGCGRSSAGDRQYIYVNGRPVDLPRAVRCINDIYRQFNSLQYPVFILDIELARDSYDVNVSPDKRKIFVHDEAAFVDALRRGLQMHYDVDSRAIRPLEIAPHGNGGAPNRKRKKHVSGSAEEATSSFEADDDEDDGIEDEDGVNDAHVMEEEEEEHGRRRNDGEYGGGGDANHDTIVERREDEADIDGQSSQSPAGHRFRLQREGTTSAARRPVKLRSFDAFAIGSVDKGDDFAEGPSAFNGYRGSMRPSASPLRNNRSRVPSSTRGATEIAATFKNRPKNVHTTNDVHGSIPSLEKFFRPSGAGIDADAGNGNWKKNKGSQEDDESDLIVIPSGARRVGDGEAMPAMKLAVDVDTDGDIHDGTHPPPGEDPRSDGGTEENVHTAGDSEAAGRRSIDVSLDSERNPSSRDELPSSVDVIDIAVTNTTAGGSGRGGGGGGGGDAGTDMTTATPKDDAHQLLDTSIDEIILQMRALNATRRHSPRTASSSRGVGRKFSSASFATFRRGGARDGGSDAQGTPEDNDAEKQRQLAAAESELRRNFNKSDFRLLRIVGQFNLGFIICCHDGNVFIIDQHAADEKANYERLEATTVLKRQPLIVPVALDVSASDEVMLLENREIFRKNGFDFHEDHSGRVGRRVLLKAVPFSKGIVFGPEDVCELLAQLQGIGDGHVDTRTIVPRPSRVRTMLASRACRYSIMIGRHLDRKRMVQVVSTLSTLRSPWNCPHGRPTMRHLVTLSALDAMRGREYGIDLAE